MLINCPECGKEISDTAKKCPNCGFKQSTKKNKASVKKWIIAGISIIGVVSLTICLLIARLSNSNADDLNSEPCDTEFHIGYNDIGCEAVKIADMYLDGKMSGEVADEKLQELDNKLEDKTHPVSIKVFLLSGFIDLADSDFSDISRSDVLKERNELAEYLNIEKRD